MHTVVQATMLIPTLYCVLVSTWLASTRPYGLFPRVDTLTGEEYVYSITTGGEAGQAWESTPNLHYRVLDADANTHVATESQPEADTDEITVASASSPQVATFSAADGTKLTHPHPWTFQDSDVSSTRWVSPGNVTYGGVTYTLPAYPPEPGEALQATNAITNETDTVNLTWTSVPVTLSDPTVGNFTNVTYKDQELSYVRYMDILDPPDSDIDLTTTGLTVAPAGWANVEVLEDEVVQLRGVFSYSNGQSSGSNVQYNEIAYLRNGVVIQYYRQQNLQIFSGAEYSSTMSLYYDDPGPGTYTYSFRVLSSVNSVARLHPSNCQVALLVEHVPHLIRETFAWK